MGLPLINNGDSGLVVRTTLNQLLTFLGANYPVTLTISDGATPTAFQLYGTIDSVAAPVNYERALFDWTTNPSILTVGTDAGGTGVGRHVFLNAASTANNAPGKVFVNTGFVNSFPALNVTISIASPAVIAPVSGLVGFFGGQPILFSTTGSLPTGLSTLTTYYVTNPSLFNFNVSATYNGANINTSGSQSGTQTATPGGVVTISNGSPATITLANHGLVPGQAVQFQTTGSLPTGLSTNTNYYVTLNKFILNLTVNTFQVSATPGTTGSPVNTSSAGSGTQTIQIQSFATTQNPTDSILTVGPFSLSGGQTAPGFLGTQVWNTTGEATIFSMNAFDINSDPSSRLLDMHTNDVSMFYVSKTGITTIAAVNATALPSASSWPGGRGTVNDATLTLATGIGTIVAGGSSNIVPVFSDGTNWRIG